MFKLNYNYDIYQLCRTGHDNVSHTRMTTLAFIFSELFPLDCCRYSFVSAPNLNTLWCIIMILVTMCRVKE